MKFKITLLAITLLIQSAFVTAEANEPHVYANIDAYNAEQKLRASNFYISPDKQVGDSCVCHTMNNIQNALTRQHTKINKEVEASCSPYFKYNYIEFKKTYQGEIFGGIYNFRGGNLVDTDDAIQQIEKAIVDGKVVAVGLNIKPIYDRYAEFYQAPYNKKLLDVFKGRNHAVVVIGLQRDNTGKLLSFLFADSSGPERKYAVSIELFRKSYDSIPAQLSRGVYIPAQPIHAKISYQP